MEFIATIIAMAVLFCVALWVIHKQTLHARDMQSMFLQRQQFNFENQWKAWIQDRTATDRTITNLASWNAKLCDSHEKMGQQLQALLPSIETRISHMLSQQLAHGLQAVLTAVGKKPT